MAKSVSQLQQEFANSSLIDELARMEDIGLNNLPATDRTIILYAQNFILRCQEYLKALDKIDKGHLINDIKQGELIKQGGNYRLTIGYPKDSKAAEYYDYVNKGVMGFVTKRPDSPYKFKNAKPSIKGPMVLALQKWMKRQGILARKEDQKYDLSSLQKKRKSISELDSSRQGAWLMARKIKRRGLPKTGFIDKAYDEYFGSGFSKALAKSVAIDMRAGIRQVESLINNENK